MAGAERTTGASWRPPRGAGALADVRVLDLAGLIPGPFCAQVLADLGADVLKVEPPAGDGARSTPSDIFHTANRNKRGVVLDLKQSEDRATLYELVAEADVVVEGFRPGVARRLGVDYEALARCQPKLVYCSISGFGEGDSEEGRPGHDISCLAASGALSYSGHWSQEPRRSGVPVADLAAAAYAAIAILAVLHERDRGGSGGHIDLAMTDAAMAFASVRGGRRLELSNEARAHLYPTNGLFRSADGELLSVALVGDSPWRDFVKAIGEEEAGGELREARFADDAGRRAHGDQLERILVRVFARRTAREWADVALQTGLAIERVETLEEASGSPRARRRGIVRELDGERHVLFPALRDGAPMARLENLAPTLGDADRL